MTRKIPLLIVLALALFGTQDAVAKTTIQKLSESRFLVGHRASTYLGHGQPKLVRRLHEEAAALCVLLGFEWYEVGDSLVKGRGWTNAAGTLDVNLYETKNSEAAIECEPVATDRAKTAMRKALRRAGIDPRKEILGRSPEPEDGPNP